MVKPRIRVSANLILGVSIMAGALAVMVILPICLHGNPNLPKWELPMLMFWLGGLNMAIGAFYLMRVRKEPRMCPNDRTPLTRTPPQAGSPLPAPIPRPTVAGVVDEFVNALSPPDWLYQIVLGKKPGNRL